MDVRKGAGVEAKLWASAVAGSLLVVVEQAVFDLAPLRLVWHIEEETTLAASLAGGARATRVEV